MSLTDVVRRAWTGIGYQIRERRLPELEEGESRIIPAFDPTLPKGWTSYSSESGKRRGPRLKGRFTSRRRAS
jgi:hypothetical protein